MATQATQTDVGAPHASDIQGAVRAASDSLLDVLTVKQSPTQRVKSLRDALDATTEALGMAEEAAERDEVRRQIQGLV